MIRHGTHAPWILALPVTAALALGCGGAQPATPPPQPKPVAKPVVERAAPVKKVVVPPSIHANNPEYAPGLEHALQVNNRLIDKFTVNAVYARAFDAGWDDANELNESFLTTARYRGCRVGAQVAGVSVTYCRAPAPEEAADDQSLEHQGITDPAFRTQFQGKRKDASQVYYGAVYDVGYRAGWKGRVSEGISDYVNEALVECTRYAKLKHATSNKPCRQISLSCNHLTEAFKRAAQTD